MSNDDIHRMIKIDHGIPPPKTNRTKEWAEKEWAKKVADRMKVGDSVALPKSEVRFINALGAAIRLTNNMIQRRSGGLVRIWKLEPKA